MQAIRALYLTLTILIGLSSSHATRPNILILLADDMGYEDVACYGSPIETPHIDRLARDGMRFTDFYAGAPNCSPSRAALMTGRIASRTGIYNYIPPNNGVHLPADEITLAKLLQDAGYATGLFGKWHLSHTEVNSTQPKPAAYGFDYTFCTRNNAEPSHKDPDNFYRNGAPLGELEGYSCQLVASEAMDWITERRSEAAPFFAYVAFHEPHKKLASPPDLMAQYPDLDKKDALYYANIANLDKAIGRILDTLDALDLTQDTFVFFASDNGPWREGSQGSLRGKKSDIWDGGIRVPGVIRWPGSVAPGQTMREPAGVVDMLPTLCTVAGAQPPGDRVIDGTDLTPLLRGEAFTRETPLYWFFYRADPQLALREGDWMLIGRIADPVGKRSHWLSAEDMPFIKSSTPTDFELYNLRQDRGQQQDLAAMETGRLEKMRAAMLSLHADVVNEGDDWSAAIAGYVR